MKKLVITWVRSAIGKPENQRLVVQGLGLKKLGQTVVRPDIPEVRGMVRKIPHLLRVDEQDG